MVKNTKKKNILGLELLLKLLVSFFTLETRGK